MGQTGRRVRLVGGRKQINTLQRNEMRGEEEWTETK